MDKRQHIVVVEDEAAQRQLLFDYLTRHGYRVTGFQSGAGLRRLVEREMPALRSEERRVGKECRL